MKILIDLQACQTASRNRGIGRYSYALAQAMAKNCGHHEIHILLNSKLTSSISDLRESFASLLPKTQIHCFASPAFTSMKTHSWSYAAAHAIRNEYISRLEPDFVHVSSLFEWWEVPTSIQHPQSEIRTSVTLYDLIPFKQPETLPNDPYAKLWYQNQIKELKHAKTIFAISDHVKSDAHQTLALPDSQVVAIGAGVSELFFQYSCASQLRAVDFLKQCGIFKPFVLTVGVIEKRKNNIRLIEAWTQLPANVRQEHQLILASNTVCPETYSELQSTLVRLQVPPQEVLFLKNLNDSDLQILYRNCRLFVLPSLFEGFGLPAAEAMVSGAPVIGSNATSIPEVIGNSEALFDPLDTAQMSFKLKEALTDLSFLNKLRSHAQEHSKRFSWNNVAQKVLTAYDSIDCKTVKERTRTHTSYREAMLRQLSEIPFQPTDKELRNAAHAVAENRKPEKRQLLIDVSVLAKSDSKTGVQRVVRNISTHMATNNLPDFDVRLIKCAENQWKYADELEKKVNQERFSQNSVGHVEIFQGDIFLGADLGLEYITAQRAWFEYVKLKGAEINFIVYDILPALMPQFFHSGIANLFIPWLNEIQNQADRIICISETVANELRAWFKDNSLSLSKIPEIRHFHLGSDLDAKRQDAANLDSKSFATTAFDGQTFLIVSTIEPRKGHEQLLNAFELLWNESQNVRLVIIGKGGWNVDHLLKRIEEHPQLNNKLIWLKHCDDDTLEFWYRNSTALISPSIAEGFGLPLIEAAQRKLPLLVRDIPVYREIAGEYAHYFLANSPQDLKTAITNWILLFKEDRHPRSDQLPWLTWRESALTLLSSMELARPSQKLSHSETTRS